MQVCRYEGSDMAGPFRRAGHGRAGPDDPAANRCDRADHVDRALRVSWSDDILHLLQDDTDHLGVEEFATHGLPLDEPHRRTRTSGTRRTAW